VTDRQPPPPPDLARRLFGESLDTATRYGRWLAGDGVDRGLIGPGEVPRLWERHLLNCAVVAEVLPLGVRCLDIGSGAGLPGIPVALARPDLTVVLVEPMARRVGFLDEVVADLGLDRVTVIRSRAEDCHRALAAPVVLARAVSPLESLVATCWPLVVPGGALYAMKGQRAAAELADTTLPGDCYGGEIVECGRGELDPPVRVVILRKSLGDSHDQAVAGGHRGRSQPPERRTPRRGRTARD